MKKETTKKSKLWIVIVVIAALLLAAGGAALAFLLPGEAQTEQTDETPAATVASGPRADLYWNLDREQYTANSQTGLSTREAGADGKFTMRFAYNGEIVELVIVDKKLVNIIDTQDVMGLTFDENGVVIGQTNIRELATEVGKKIFVKKTTADTIVANSSMAMNGMELNLKMGQYAEIYDLRPESENFGKKITTADLIVMDCITVYANADGDITHVYLLSSSTRSKIYWRANLWVSSTANRARLHPDENGVYSLPFYCDGELVDVKTTDVELVDYYAEMGKHSGFTGLIFDENGFAVDIMNTAVGVAGQQTFFALDVTEINGDYVKLKAVWSTSGVQNWEGTIPASTPIYDVSACAYMEGTMGKKLSVTDLRVGDRITLYSDMEGNPIEAGVTLRRVDLKPMFNNSSKFDNSAAATTRVKDADGYWVYTFINEKGITKYKTKDQKIADFIDMWPERVVGLVTKGETIVRAYDYESIYGYVRFSTALYVDSINGTIISCTDQNKANAYTAVLADGYQTLDISGDSQQWGQKIKLQPGDCMISFRNTNKEVCMIYVTKRAMGGALYVNTTPNTSRETIKVMSEDGKTVVEEYWQFEMTDLNGKQVTLKLPVGKKVDGVFANKHLQSRIDSATKGIIALEVSKGVIKDAHAVANMASGNAVSTVFITEAGTTEFKYKTVAKAVGVEGGATVYPGWTGSETMKMINLSGDYKSHKGEKLTGGMKVGDVYYMVRNRANETVAMFLTSRGYHNNLFFVKDAKPVINGVTTRQPNAEGYYVFSVMYDGKAATVRTKDVAIATALETKNTGASLKLDKTDKKNIVLAVSDYTGTNDAYASLVSNWDVSKISGKNITLTLNIPTTSTTVGDTKEVDITGAKIYNISPNAGAEYGKETKLQKNDRVRIFTDKNGKVSYVLVTVRNGVKVAECAHCGKKVTWNPLTANSGMGTGDAHYYIYADWDVYGQQSVSSTAIDKYEVVIDLNGKTVFNKGNTARTFMVAYPGKTLTLLDSVGGGTVKSYGYNGNAGLIQVSYGATLNILSGTYQLVNEEGKVTPKQGGVIFSWNDNTASGYPDYRNTVNIKGGTIIGAAIEHPNRTNGVDPLMKNDFAAGGTLYAQWTDVNISGGKIYGGTADRGGNIYLGSSAVLTITGGEISGGIARNRGGNIYGASGSKIVVNGGKITDGKIQGIDIAYEENGEAKTKHTGQQGGNICGYEVVLKKGEITGGYAKTTGGNIFLLGYIKSTVNGETVITGNSLTMTGGKIAGGTAGSGGGNVFVYGGEGLVAIQGGEIDANGVTIGYDSDTSMASAMTMTGGKVGAVGVQKNCAIVVGGDAKIDSLNLNATAKMGITELSSTAKIVVTAAGKFASAAKGSESLDISAYADNQIVSSDKKGVISCTTEGGVQWLVSGTKDMHEVYKTVYEKSVKMTTDGVFAAGGTVTATCPACEATVTWTPLTATTTSLDADGHYYLPADVTRSDNSRFSVTSGTVCIHLNGHTYDQAATSAVEGAIKVSAGATLNMMGNGTVIGAGSYVSSVSSYTGGAIDIRGTVNLMGGTYTSSHNRPAVACFAGNGATLNMYAGTLQAGTAVTDNAGSYCGTFMMYNSTHVFNMYGGSAVGGDAGAYGNLKLVGGTANLLGGTVSGRVVTGGTATINIGNGMKIGAGNGGLVIKSGVTVKLADDLAAGTEIYISETAGDEAGLTVANSKAAAYVEAGYIKSTNTSRPAMVNSSNQIYIASMETAMNTLSATLAASTTNVTALCPICGETVTWTAVTNEYVAGLTLSSGNYYLDGEGAPTHYYLAETVNMPLNGTSATRFATTSGQIKTTCLHLNGKTLNQTGASSSQMGVLLVGKGTTLNIMDAANNAGTVIGGGLTASSMYSGALDVRGTANIYGGTFKSAVADRPAVALFSVSTDAEAQLNVREINMYGGVITRGDAITGTTAEGSSNVWVNANTQVFNMYGGTIENGKAANGGNLRMKGGAFNLNGGTITGGESANLGGNVCVRGGTFTLTKGTVTNGTTASSGGNFGLVSGTIAVNGGEISNGTGTNSGNIHVYAGTLNITGGEIKNGTGAGGNINLSYTAGVTITCSITGGSITGGKVSAAEDAASRDVTVGATRNLNLGKNATIGALYASGTVTVQNGTVATVELAPAGRIALASDVAEGTKVNVVAAATQTIATIENAADFLGYFETSVAGATIGVKADTTNEIEIVVPVAE